MMVYFSKVILCSGLMLALYLVILEKVKIYQFNRWYLLMALVIPFGIPLVELKFDNFFFQNQISYTVPIANSFELVRQNLVKPNPEIPTNQEFSIIPIIWAIYSLVTSLLIFRFIKNIFALLKIKKYGKLIKKNSYQIILTDYNETPFSFHRSIFMNKEKYENNKLEKEVLEHEIAHVNQGHTYDILFLEILAAFFWFNPFVIFYGNSIRLNHEFLADEEVLNKYENRNRYQNLLLNEIGLKPTKKIASQFNYLFTKKRIQMMNKSQKGGHAFIAKFLVLPLIAVLITVFGEIGIAQYKKTNVFEKSKTFTEANEAQMNEYKILAMKYVSYPKKNYVKIGEIPEEDRARLQELFLIMNKKQQQSQKFIMTPPLPPLPKITPTEKEFENYKNASIYGVWLNEKKIKNSDLNKYKAEDIYQVFVSKLMPNAQKTIDYKYKYQVDMMTKEYYEEYEFATLSDKKYFLRYNIKVPI